MNDYPLSSDGVKLHPGTLVWNDYVQPGCVSQYQVGGEFINLNDPNTRQYSTQIHRSRLFANRQNAVECRKKNLLVKKQELQTELDAVNQELNSL